MGIKIDIQRGDSQNGGYTNEWSSIVNEVIRTILFFLQENFVSIKSTKRYIKQTKIKKE